jgi:hypothetical protein
MGIFPLPRSPWKFQKLQISPADTCCFFFLCLRCFSSALRLPSPLTVGVVPLSTTSC